MKQYNDLILYHGSDADITQFSTNFVTKWLENGDTGNSADGPGIYFSNQKDDARRYSEGSFIYTVGFNNPTLVSESEPPLSRDIIRKIILGEDINIDLDELIEKFETEWRYDYDKLPIWAAAATDFDENILSGLDAMIDLCVDAEDEFDSLMSIYSMIFRYEQQLFFHNLQMVGIDGFITPKREGVIHYIVYNPNKLQILNKEVIMSEQVMNIKKSLRESLLDEAYPVTFNMDEFKALRSFNARIKYCTQYLQRIGSGSSRIVFKIDDEKVLKLARNIKGVAQNEAEFDNSNNYLLNHIVAKVFDVDNENFLWLEMELASKVNFKMFEEVTGVSFPVYQKVILRYGSESGNGGYLTNIDDDIYFDLWENEFVYDILQYIGNHDVPVMDLTKISSYGKVQRDGYVDIVLVDYGMNNDVKNIHY
jgi:hypothetical protein